MTEPGAIPNELPTVPLDEPARASTLRLLIRNPLAVITSAYLLVVILLAAFAGVLAPYDPNTASAANTMGNPTAHNLLGTDASGHDVFSRLLFASQLSLAAAALALVVAAIVGVTNGLIAGYYGKTYDAVATWFSSILQALPGIVVLLAARAVLGPSIWVSMGIFGVLISPVFYRVVYSAVTAVRSELYVDAARVAGLSDARIIAKHILTVVRAPAIVVASNVAGIAIAIQAGLDFLGLGDPSAPTWGGMLNDAYASLYIQPLLLIWPSLAIGLTCLALALLSNALRDVLERTGAVAPRPKKIKTPSIEKPVRIATNPVVVHDEPLDREVGEELLTVTDLEVGYRQSDGTTKIVVAGVSLSVRRGEIHSLIGESGSGKTQTAWSILRLLPAGGRIVGGTIAFQGTPLEELGEKAMRKFRGLKIAYVPQEPMSNLDPASTIGTQLTDPLRRNLRLSKSEAKDRAIKMLARVGIPDPARTFGAYAHEISGGMAQRVLIAGAVLCQPDLLIADEPTTALDVTVQAEVLDLLRDLQREFGMGMVLVTHNFGVVADLADRVSVMQAGRIVETGPVGSIFANPQHPYTKSLFEAILEDGAPRGPLVSSSSSSSSTNQGLVA